MKWAAAVNIWDICVITARWPMPLTVLSYTNTPVTTINIFHSCIHLYYWEYEYCCLVYVLYILMGCDDWCLHCLNEYILYCIYILKFGNGHWWIFLIIKNWPKRKIVSFAIMFAAAIMYIYVQYVHYYWPLRISCTVHARLWLSADELQGLHGL